MRILDVNPIGSPPVSIGDLKLAPKAWDTRIDSQLISTQFESENIFQGRSIHPAGRARVPRPSAPAGVWRHSVDISGRNIRFDFVLVQACTRRSVINRIK